MEGITEPLYDLLHLIKFKRQKQQKKNRKFATNRRKSKRNIDKKIK
jgi:hypothetical protein